MEAFPGNSTGPKNPLNSFSPEHPYNECLHRAAQSAKGSGESSFVGNQFPYSGRSSRYPSPAWQAWGRYTKSGKNKGWVMHGSADRGRTPRKDQAQDNCIFTSGVKRSQTTRVCPQRQATALLSKQRGLQISHTAESDTANTISMYLTHQWIFYKEKKFHQ